MVSPQGSCGIPRHPVKLQSRFKLNNLSTNVARSIFFDDGEIYSAIGRRSSRTKASRIFRKVGHSEIARCWVCRIRNSWYIVKSRSALLRIRLTGVVCLIIPPIEVSVGKGSRRCERGGRLSEEIHVEVVAGDRIIRYDVVLKWEGFARRNDRVAGGLDDRSSILRKCSRAAEEEGTRSENGAEGNHREWDWVVSLDTFFQGLYTNPVRTGSRKAAVCHEGRSCMNWTDHDPWSNAVDL